MNAVFQGFSIGANIWMTKWSDDKDIVDANGTVDAGKRDMYVTVYGLLGLGQGMFYFFITI